MVNYIIHLLERMNNVMKKSMSEYIAILSESNYEILEEIFEDKYKKFISIYWLIRDYSDYITSLKYKKTKKDILKIEITLTKNNIDKVMKKIKSDINSDSNVLVSNEGKIIKIEITKEESV